MQADSAICAQTDSTICAQTHMRYIAPNIREQNRIVINIRNAEIRLRTNAVMVFVNKRYDGSILHLHTSNSENNYSHPFAHKRRWRSKFLSKFGLPTFKVALD